MKRPYFGLLFFVLLFTQLFVFTFAQTQSESINQTKLELSQPIERELKGGEAHTYSIQVKANQLLKLIVEQRGIDVVVAIFAPDGKKVTEVDSPNGTKEPETVIIITKASGSYRVEVRSLEKAAATGQYEVKIDVLRAPTNDDLTQELAEKLIAAKTESERTALLSAHKTLVTSDLALALYNRGQKLRSQRNLPQALNALSLAQNVAQQSGAKDQLPTVLGTIGDVYAEQRNFAKSLEVLNRSLALTEELNDKSKTISALSSLGTLFKAQGEYARALEYFQRALIIAEGSGNKPFMAKALMNMGLIHASEGDHPKALQLFQKALTLTEELGDKLETARLRGSIGISYNRQGVYSLALENYQKSLELFQELGDKTGAVRTLGNMGITYGNQGDRLRRFDINKKVLALFEELGDKNGIARALSNIGTDFRIQGDFTQAFEYYRKSLELRQSIGDQEGIAVTLNHIGWTLYRQNKLAEALENFQKSLAIREKFKDNERIAETLENIGKTYYGIGDHKKALEFSERAAALAKEYNIREIHWSALTEVGKAHQALKQNTQARQAFEEAIRVVESIRTDIAGQVARASYFALAKQSYEFYIDFLMQQHKESPSAGNDVLAFQISERVRARSLLELLNEAQVDIRHGVDNRLLENELILRQKLNTLAARETRLLSGNNQVEEVTTLQKEITCVTAEYQDIQAQIRRGSPHYAALTQSVPLSSSQIQRDLLDNDTVLLEYALGKDRSYLWVVGKTTLNSYELPNRETIENAARRVYGLLTDGKRWAQDNDINAQYAEASAQLSEMLLSPVAGQLKGKRLIVVSDGFLQYIPLGALPLPQTAQKIKNTTPKAEIEPLAVRNEIVNLPSASTLAVLRRETGNRKPGSKGVAVFADPVFTETDERLTEVKTNQEINLKPDVNLNSSRSILERAFKLRDKSTEPLPITRLPFTRREAEAILQSAPKDSSLKALDFTANRERVLSSDLSNYRIVHFATHGILNSENPELSGIVLSLVNEKGQPIDGFLRLNEIYNLNLGADLVVLSACQTALGKEVRGEGLIGLTRGFMYAGSPRVIASLWKVDDVATAELMKLFYQKMLQENMRPAAALRAAKVEMWKQKRWSAPFYWAAFELQGEWK